MSYQQTWEIDGITYPTVPCGLEFAHAKAQAPCSYAYLCPVCGNVWARRRISNPSTRWLCVHQNCVSCGERTLLTDPGSVMQFWCREFFLNLPREILERELFLYKPKMGELVPRDASFNGASACVAAVAGHDAPLHPFVY